MKTPAELRDEVMQLLEKIDAFGPSPFGGRMLLCEVPSFVEHEDGYPHVEVDEGGYHYVQTERNSELRRDTFPEADGLLYYIFSQATYQLAVTYSNVHRVPGHDPRRAEYRRQLELLSMLSPAWAERKAAEHREILRQQPFLDSDR